MMEVWIWLPAFAAMLGRGPWARPLVGGATVSAAGCALLNGHDATSTALWLAVLATLQLLHPQRIPRSVGFALSGALLAASATDVLSIGLGLQIVSWSLCRPASRLLPWPFALRGLAMSVWCLAAGGVALTPLAAQPGWIVVASGLLVASWLVEVVASDSPDDLDGLHSLATAAALSTWWTQSAASMDERWAVGVVVVCAVAVVARPWGAVLRQSTTPPPLRRCVHDLLTAGAWLAAMSGVMPLTQCALGFVVVELLRPDGTRPLDGRDRGLFIGLALAAAGLPGTLGFQLRWDAMTSGGPVALTLWALISAALMAWCLAGRSPPQRWDATPTRARLITAVVLVVISGTAALP